MGYQRGVQQQAGPIVAVEQARKRNAELHIELRNLEAAATALHERIDSARRTLDDQLTEAKAELSKARDNLTRVIKATDAARIQASNIAAAALHASTLPEPIHGGRAGLEAATRELYEYEARKKAGKVASLPDRTARPRPVKGPSHGTHQRYVAGCRCGECRAYKAAAHSRHRKRAA